MIVPTYWAENSQKRQRPNGKRITIRRFGWSDLSQQDALRMATQRATEAADRWLTGATTPNREPKVPYNGADGVPIREEIVTRQGETIITRNGYGARCMNTPSVLFADLDLGDIRTLADRYGCHLYLAAAIGIILAVYLRSITIAAIVLVTSWIISKTLASLSAKNHSSQAAATSARLRENITRFIQAHPHWHLRVYQTPAGFRLLAMHQTFDPRSEEVTQAFQALGVDPAFFRMCRVQNCFRARLTGKPWRMGITNRLKPRPGVWPIKPHHLPARQTWVENYETIAATHAACHYIESLGNTTNTHPEALAVQTWHDSLSQAHTNLPLA
jgi:hypothetical protein